MPQSINFNPETLGIPADIFNTLKNVVFTEIEETKVVFYQTVEMLYNYNAQNRRIAPFSGIVTKARLETVRRAQGQYGLNMVKNDIHEFDYEYEGQGENGEFIFFKPEINFTMNGIPYTIDADSFIIYGSNGKWIKERKLIKSFIYNNKEYSFAEVANMLKISTEELSNRLTYKEIGYERNPNMFITSMFSLVEKEGNNYVNKTMINGIQWNEFVGSGKITCYSKPFPGFVFRWKCFNGNPTGVWGADWVIDRVEKTDPRATSITIADDKVNLDAEMAVLELQLEELPAQGKSYSTESYLDLKTGSKLFRMPRKPVS